MVRFLALATFNPQADFSYSFELEAQVIQAIVHLEGLSQLKECSDVIGS
jgi:hypothetical protein